MKKVFSLMLVVLLCLAFTACGEEDKAADATATTVPAAPSDTNGNAIPTVPTESSPIQTPELNVPSFTTPTQATTASIVGSWKNADGLLMTFNADGSLVLSDGAETVTMKWSANGNQISLIFDGETETGSYAISGDTLTMISPDGEVETFVKADSPIQTPSLVTPSVTTPVVNNDAAAQAVATFVAENQADLLAMFESSFADAANGITCSSDIKAVGTGFIINVKVSALNGATEEQIQVMEQTYDSLQSTFDQALTQMQSGLPELTYFTINVCDGYGNVLTTVHAGN